jgi:hypothetical protein
MVAAALNRPASTARISAIIRFCCLWNANPDAAPRRFRLVVRVRPRSSQIRLSNSPRANDDARTDVRHRPCCLVGAGCAVISLPSSHEGAERRMALATRGTFAKAPACRVSGTRASRRSTVAFLLPGTALPGAGRTSLTSPRSRRHLRRPSVRPRPAIEGSSHLAMGTGGGPRRPGRCLRKHSDPGATPCSANQAPLADALD